MCLSCHDTGQFNRLSAKIETDTRFAYGDDYAKNFHDFDSLIADYGM